MSEPLLMISVQSLKLFVVARIVREVLGEKDWIPIPGTRQELPGVIGWGRRAVAMLDLARMVADLRPLQVGETRARMLLLQLSDSNLAIPADSVQQYTPKEPSNQLLRCRGHHLGLFAAGSLQAL